MVKKQISPFLVVLLLLASACHTKTAAPTQMVAEPEVVLHDFNSFWVYWNDYVFLQNDFTGLDTNGNRVSSERFLEQLTTGGYLPIRYVTSDTLRQYKLVKFDTATHRNISETIAMYSQHYLTGFKMRSVPLPEFQFTDIYGTPFNKQDCQGKIVVINCWFIHCVACVQEMPDLNKLVEKYKGHHDIIFLGLASDTKEQLLDFKKKRQFDYHLIPNKGNYMQNSLQIFEYPTQIVIDRAGKIFRVVNSYAELKVAINKAYN